MGTNAISNRSLPDERDAQGLPANISIGVLEARLHPSVSDEFHRGVVECYSRFGAPASAASEEDAKSDGVYVVCASDEDGRLLGGIRIHLRTPGGELPIERSLRSYDVDLQHLELFQPNVCGMSALWAVESARGTELGARIMETVIAVTPLLGITRICMLAHTRLDRLHQSVGFRPDEVTGSIAYPDERYESRVYCAHTLDLFAATDAARGRILAVRARMLENAQHVWPLRAA